MTNWRIGAIARVTRSSDTLCQRAGWEHGTVKRVTSAAAATRSRGHCYQSDGLTCGMLINQNNSMSRVGFTIRICAVILADGSAGITSRFVGHVSNPLGSASAVINELQFRNRANAIKKVLTPLALLFRLSVPRSAYIKVAFRQVVVYIVDT